MKDHNENSPQAKGTWNLLPWVLLVFSVLAMFLLSVVANMVSHMTFHLFMDYGDALPAITILALGIATHLSKVVIAFGLLAAVIIAWKGAGRMGTTVIAFLWVSFCILCGFVSIALLLPLQFLCSHAQWYVP